VRDGTLILAWHAETRAEVLHVLGPIPPLRQLDVADLFRPEAVHDVPLDVMAYAFIADPVDRIFAALAEAASAAFVTNDAHLLDHRHALCAPVLTPRACWEALVINPDIDDGRSGAPTEGAP